jgi:hypothetical protein
MMRKITPKMFKFINDKLKTNGAAQNAIINKDARSLLIYAAEACVGIKEEGGNNRGLYVSEIQKTSDGRATQEAWCMEAVQAWISYVETKLNIVSPLFTSAHCLTTWRRTPAKQRVKISPLPGAIIIWQHGTSQAGHTGILTEPNPARKTMETVEGNTGDGSFRDGDGIYIRNRSMVKNGKMKVVGFLKPF